MSDGADAVTRLQRWEAFGAPWQLVDDDGRRVTVALCRCDGGEEVDRLTSADPALRAFLDGRTSSVADEG
ncbi:hypothetical protein SAMN04488543_0544 [Friedmanniella luteola]|uniref:Uncharacterized protein n=1 Tax=Friedmanniella luteola TaxID=546871 RepID=A0A1H1M5M5_9ACTN|nr:hypothetical protein [Friedmanniella luteola]SDR81705.1 hypothetical protein SAMN04488543_0544 [Friedmanniella luteola]